jgi:putative acetyltransferase
VRLVSCPEARSADAGRFVRRLLHEEFGFEPDDTLDSDLDDPVRHYRGAGGELWLLEDEAGIIRGTTAVRPLGGADAELKRMFVEREWRGRGHGHALLLGAVEFCKRAGFRRLLLDTTLELERALRLYRAFGFCDTRPYNDNPRAECWLVLEL